MREEVLMIPLAAIMLPLVLVPTIMVLKFRANKREFEHKERMKALETGRALPQYGAWPAAFVCSSIGAGVPAAAFFFTWLSSISSAKYEDMWAAPTFVGLAGVIAGTSLAFRLFAREQGQSSPETDPNHKVFYADPDAFDVVGRRG